MANALRQVYEPTLGKERKTLLDRGWDWNPQPSITSPTIYQMSYKTKPRASRGMVVFVFDISNLTSFLHISTDYVCYASKVKKLCGTMYLGER